MVTHKSPMAKFARTARETRIVSEICMMMRCDAMRVDAVLAKLKLDNPTWHKVLVLAFVWSLNAAQIGLRIGMSRYVAAKKYECAYSSVEDHFSIET